MSEIILGINDIKALIPHRFPMLMIDRVVITKPGEEAVGYKSVTANEHFFEGHFPDHPVMPGVLIVEAMAQTAGVIATHSMGEESQGKPVFFMSIEEAKFRKPVVPGDQLEMTITVERGRGRVWRFLGEARVAGVKTTEARFSAMLSG